MVEKCSDEEDHEAEAGARSGQDAMNTIGRVAGVFLGAVGVAFFASWLYAVFFFCMGWINGMPSHWRNVKRGYVGGICCGLAGLLVAFIGVRFGQWLSN